MIYASVTVIRRLVVVHSAKLVAQFLHASFNTTAEAQSRVAGNSAVEKCPSCRLAVHADCNTAKHD